MATPNPWTDDRKLKLKQWWLQEHKTSTEIVLLFARQGFQTTRNAIIGAVHRSDWWAGLTRTRTPPKPRKPKVKKVSAAGNVIVKEPPLPPPIRLRTPPPAAPPPPVPGQPMFLSVVQIGHDQCRYWYGDCRAQAGTESETGYCGHKTSEGHHSWCDAHLRLVYAKPPPQGRMSIPVKF